MNNQKRIQQLAAQRAADVFLDQKLHNTVLQKPEAIAALAEEETTRFTHEHPEFQPPQEAAEWYRAVFVRGYQQHLTERGAASYKEDIKRDLPPLPPSDR